MRRYSCRASQRQLAGSIDENIDILQAPGPNGSALSVSTTSSGLSRQSQRHGYSGGVATVLSHQEDWQNSATASSHATIHDKSSITWIRDVSIVRRCHDLDKCQPASKCSSALKIRENLARETNRFVSFGTSSRTRTEVRSRPPVFPNPRFRSGREGSGRRELLVEEK